jgi:hypothetical protein
MWRQCSSLKYSELLTWQHSAIQKLNLEHSYHLHFMQLWLPEIFIFLLLLSQAILTSSLLSKFFKATNLSEILTSYYILTSTTFKFSRLNLSILEILHCLFTDWQTIPTICIYQTVISIAVSPSQNQTSCLFKCHLLSERKCLTSLSSFSWGGAQVYLWQFQCGNNVHLTVTFFDVSCFTTHTVLSVLVSHKLSFLVVNLKISLLQFCTEIC